MIADCDASKSYEGKAFRGYAMTCLIVLYMFNTMDRQILAILGASIQAEFGISNTQLGLLGGPAFAIFYTFFGIPAGWLADRVGQVRIISIACTLWSLFSAAGALTTSFIGLALTRMGVGIGEAGGTAPSYSLIASLYPGRGRSAALGTFHLGSPLGALVSATLGAWLAASYGWRTALVAVSLPGIAVALIVWLTIPSPPTAPESKEKSSSIRQAVTGFFSDPVLRLTALGSGLTAFNVFALAAWGPVFLIRVKGMTLIDIATWYGVPSGLLAALGLWLPGMLASRLADRTPRAYALIPLVAMLALVPLIVAAVNAPGWPIAMAFLLLAYGMSNMFMAPMVTIVQARSPDTQRGTYSAVFLFVNNLIGAGLGPLYVGVVSDLFAPSLGEQSLKAGLMALVPVALCASLIYWRLSNRLSADAQQESAKTYP